MENIQELVTELERQKENSWDRVINAENILAMDTLAGFELRFPDKDGIDEGFPLTGYSKRQLATKLGIPWRYFERMLQNEKYELITQNINEWLGDNDFLMRVLDGEIRAVLSSKYKTLDHLSLVFAALDTFREYSNEVVIHDCALTEERMYVKATMPYNEKEIIEDDKVIPGIVLSNSEVGAGAMRISPLMILKRCDNGLIGEHKFARVHLGMKRGEGVIDWSQRTKELEQEIYKSKIHDVIKNAFDPMIFEKWVEAIRKGTQFEIPRRDDAVESVSIEFKFSEKEKKDILEHFSDEKRTQWGLANGVTRTARDLDNYDRRIELEKIGAEIATMPGVSLNEILKIKKELKEGEATE